MWPAVGNRGQLADHLTRGQNEYETKGYQGIWYRHRCMPLQLAVFLGVLIEPRSMTNINVFGEVPKHATRDVLNLECEPKNTLKFLNSIAKV